MYYMHYGRIRTHVYALLADPKSILTHVSASNSGTICSVLWLVMSISSKSAKRVEHFHPLTTSRSTLYVPHNKRGNYLYHLNHCSIESTGTNVICRRPFHPKTDYIVHEVSFTKIGSLNEIHVRRVHITFVPLHR